MTATRWLSTAQAARRLKLSRSRVKALIWSGALPAIRAGTGRTSPYRVTEQAVSDCARRRAGGLP